MYTGDIDEALSIEHAKKCREPNCVIVKQYRIMKVNSKYAKPYTYSDIHTRVTTRHVPSTQISKKTTRDREE